MARGLVGAISDQTNRSKSFVSIEDFNAFRERFIVARVTDIVYDENSPNFQAYGEWNGIGTTEFEIVDNQTSDDSIGRAYPLFSSVKQYPLINETVYLVRLSDANINSDTASTSYFYMNPTSVWNHPHHNAIPNPVKAGGVTSEQQRDYTQAGSARRVEDGSTEIDLNGESGGTFVEQTNIHPILPFAGDVIMEGRFGNSIRLGNTSKTDSSYANIWSSNGDNGSPITIIRNGQPADASDEGWLPITEDVNKDISSVTLTADQKLPLELSNEDYSAFRTAPETAAEYAKNQVVLNSGRLIFNSKSSDVVISSAGNVAINAIKTMGISADADLVLNSSDVRIGNKDADQRLVRGDDFMIQFQALVQGISNLCDKLKTAQNWPGGAAVPNVPVMTVAINTKITADKILSNMKGDNKLLSKVSKTS